ncbi:MAG: ATP-dependent RNA helicase HrpA, partial [Actinomycetota bacterium]|nr:ATP-dependent RNA helicase HrpA [Actinomycetota bacterium]
WEYLGDERKARTSNQFRRMCRNEYLNYRRVREWQDLHAQLRDVTRELGFTTNRRSAERENVHRTVLTGLLSNVGRKESGSHEYRGARGSRFSINPGSTLFKGSPEWVMAAELVETARLWARGVVAVQPEWIEQAAAHLVTRSYSDPWWDADRGAAFANETVTLYGLPLQAERPALYSRVDADAARELFIRHALVAGEWETHHRFAEHNSAIIDEVLDLEARYRRADLFVDDETVVDFFDERIPDDIVSVRHFDRWWKEERVDNPSLLDLSVDDLLDPDVEMPDEEAFPEVWQYGDVTMPVAYEFDPASDSDGATIDIPIGGLSRIDPEIFDGHVPGLREELVIAMMRALPKPIRKRLAPIPETARSVLEAYDPDRDRFVPFLRGELTRRSGIAVPPDAFDPDRLPSHLRPTFRVVDSEGSVLADGGDLRALKDKLQDEARAAMGASGHEIERTGMATWDLDDLPRSVEIDGPGRTVTAYPALVDEGDSVAVRLYATPAERDAAMWEGTRRLVMLGLPSPSRYLRSLVTSDGRAAITDGPHGSFDAWAADCLTCVVDEMLSERGGPVWERAAFERLLTASREESDGVLVGVASEALEVLDEVRTVRYALASLTGERFTPAVADMEEQIGRLIYAGFVTSVGIDRLVDLVRYVQAIGRRIEQLRDHVDRDREYMERVQDLEADRDDLSDAMPGSVELIEVAWMLQELRVSLFAQELGTKGKISEKRVREALAQAVEP